MSYIITNYLLFMHFQYCKISPTNSKLENQELFNAQTNLHWYKEGQAADLLRLRRHLRKCSELV